MGLLGSWESDPCPPARLFPDMRQVLHDALARPSERYGRGLNKIPETAVFVLQGFGPMRKGSLRRGSLAFEPDPKPP